MTESTFCVGAIDRQEKEVEQPEVGEGVEERGGEEEGGGRRE